MSSTPAAPTPAASDPSPPPTPPDPTAFEHRITELQSQLATARDALTRSERRREVDRLLLDNNATDVEAAAALIMDRIASAASPNPDLAEEIRALKRRKPALFKHAAPPSSMAGRAGDPPESPADTAHREAATGGRAALLRYMRARRA